MFKNKVLIIAFCLLLAGGVLYVSQAKAVGTGDLVKIDGLDTIWLIEDDGKRHVIYYSENEHEYWSKVMESHGYSQSSAITISMAEAESYMLGGNVTIKPQTYLLQKMSDNTKVYIVESTNQIMEVNQETEWQGWIYSTIQVPDHYFTNYEIIDRPNYENKLVKYTDTDDEIYAIINDNTIHKVYDNEDGRDFWAIYWNSVIDSHDINKSEALPVSFYTITTLFTGDAYTIAPSKGYILKRYTSDNYLVVDEGTIILVSEQYLSDNGFDIANKTIEVPESYFVRYEITTDTSLLPEIDVSEEPQYVVVNLDIDKEKRLINALIKNIGAEETTVVSHWIHVKDTDTNDEYLGMSTAKLDTLETRSVTLESHVYLNKESSQVPVKDSNIYKLKAWMDNDSGNDYLETINIDLSNDDEINFKILDLVVRPDSTGALNTVGVKIYTSGIIPSNNNKIVLDLSASSMDSSVKKENSYIFFTGGEQEIKVWEYNWPNGLYEVSAHIDSTNVVLESDEDDNIFTKSLSFMNTKDCIDDDNGKNYYVRGEGDECVDMDGQTLKEAFCIGKEMNAEIVKCEYGCSVAACLKERPICEDTDPRNNLFIKGYATINEGKTKIYDQCGSDQGYESDTLILEAYCDAGRLKLTSNRHCPGKCENGACIADEETIVINTKANLLYDDKFDEILSEIKELRDVVREQTAKINYLEKLTNDVSTLSAKIENALNNFITYGVDENTKRLGEGERAAVIHSFKKAFGKLPDTEDELADAIKIANGRWPNFRNDLAEKEAREHFQKIYKRIAHMDEANDDAAITVMAYGLRQKAENRNLESEKQGIKTFMDIYGNHPASTEDWNIMQAITYSGASRGADSDGDLLLDEREAELGTDPNNPDTDGDGYGDGVEVANGYDPLK